MTAPHDEAATDLQAINAQLRAERDAALAREAAVAARLAQRDSEYGERIDHQAATNRVLQAMSASPGDPQPVFDLIVQQAQALCNSGSAMLFQYDGTLLQCRVLTSVILSLDEIESYKRLYP